MITVRRSKLNAAHLLNDFLQNNRPYFMDNDKEVEDIEELESFRDYSEGIIEIRENGGLFVGEDITQEELQNTFNYVEYLEKEEYEKLIEYKVIEDI